MTLKEKILIDVMREIMNDQTSYQPEVAVMEDRFSMGKASIEDCMERYANIMIALKLKKIAEQFSYAEVEYDDGREVGELIEIDGNYVIIQTEVKKVSRRITDIKIL